MLIYTIVFQIRFVKEQSMEECRLEFARRSSKLDMVRSWKFTLKKFYFLSKFLHKYIFTEVIIYIDIYNKITEKVIESITLPLGIGRDKK